MSPSRAVKGSPALHRAPAHCGSVMRHEKVSTRRPRATPCRMRRAPARTAAADTPNGRLAHARRHAARAQSPCGTPFYCTVETCSSDRNATEPTSWHNTAMRQEKIFMHCPWIGRTSHVSRPRETHETSLGTETEAPEASRNTPGIARRTARPVAWRQSCHPVPHVLRGNARTAYQIRPRRQPRMASRTHRAQNRVPGARYRRQ